MATRKLVSRENGLSRSTQSDLTFKVMVDRKKRAQVLSPRPISTANLNALLHSQSRPINPVVFRRPYSLAGWDIESWGVLGA